jgi:hypothetical protein
MPQNLILIPSASSQSQRRQLKEITAVRAVETHGSAARISALFPDQNQDACDQREDRKQDAGGAEAYSENADDAGEDKVNGEHEHADVFGYHEAILRHRRRLSRANLCDFRKSSESRKRGW